MCMGSPPPAPFLQGNKPPPVAPPPPKVTDPKAKERARGASKAARLAAGVRSKTVLTKAAGLDDENLNKATQRLGT